MVIRTSHSATHSLLSLNGKNSRPQRTKMTRQMRQLRRRPVAEQGTSRVQSMRRLCAVWRCCAWCRCWLLSVAPESCERSVRILLLYAVAVSLYLIRRPSRCWWRISKVRLAGKQDKHTTHNTYNCTHNHNPMDASDSAAHSSRGQQAGGG
jgi:hypothetical protein